MSSSNLRPTRGQAGSSATGAASTSGTPGSTGGTGTSTYAGGGSGTSRATQEWQRLEHHGEGPVARGIEQQTAKLPSDVFLWAALGSMGLSLAMQVAGRKHGAQFIGQWVPTFLIFGLYNKIVKVAGSDRFDQQQQLQH